MPMFSQASDQAKLLLGLIFEIRQVGLPFPEPNWQPSRKVWDKTVKCYYCHSKGHVLSKCLKVKRDQD